MFITHPECFSLKRPKPCERSPKFRTSSKNQPLPLGFNKWGFPWPWGSPIAGWFISGEIPPWPWMMTGATPIYGNPFTIINHILTMNHILTIIIFSKSFANLGNFPSANLWRQMSLRSWRCHGRILVVPCSRWGSPVGPVREQ